MEVPNGYSNLIKDTNRRDKLVVDLCDFCHCYIKVRLQDLPFRTRGFRLACFKCKEEFRLNKELGKFIFEQEERV